MIIAIVAGLLAFLAARFRPGASRRVSTATVTAVICLALGAVTAAMASLNVALPDLARSTQATQTQLEWIIDAYSLVFAALLLPAGALGDRYGRRRALLAGLAVGGRDDRLVGQRTDRPARRDRPGRGAGHAGHAVHHHRHLPARGAHPCGQR